MILNRPGDLFAFNGVQYTIGDTVMATKSSDYAGLFGTITEIRTGPDMETENDGIDIYCEFEPPVAPYDIEQLEARFSALYQTEKKLENITLDFVIVAPDEICIIPKSNVRCIVYAVQCSWADEINVGSQVEIFGSYALAKRCFNKMLYDEMHSGLVAQWKEKYEFAEESKCDWYEAYIEGYYVSAHYKLEITEMPLQGGR